MKKLLLLSFFFMGASLASYAHCGSCGSGEKDHKHDKAEMGCCGDSGSCCTEKSSCDKDGKKCSEKCDCGDKCKCSKEAECTKDAKCEKGECGDKKSCSDKGKCGVEEKTVIKESDVCCGKGGSCCKRRVKKAMEAQEAAAKKAEIPMPKMACCAKDA